MEKFIYSQYQHKTGETCSKLPIMAKDPERIFAERKKNVAAAIDHITSNISPDGYVRAATDYTWYKLMWFRDSAMISSSLSQAASSIKRLGDSDLMPFAEKARDGALKILSKQWSLIDYNREKLRSTASMSLEDLEIKKLKNHIPARIDSRGNLADIEIDGKHINDLAEAENPNSWLKQFDSIPLVLHATSEFVKAFGADSLTEPLRGSIHRNIGVIADYIINVYKCPCADVWEQNPHMLHSYDIGAAYAGLDSVLYLSSELGIGIDADKINREIYGSAGIINFMNEFFVKDGVLRKYRGEFSIDVAENPKVDASAYLLFALFDPEHSLVNEDVYSKTMEALRENHIFRSQDGKRIYESPFPKRYEGDRYFGGSGWILLGAAEAYLNTKNGNNPRADYILESIEKLVPKSGFSLPEQDPMDEGLLNPYREGESDAIGKKPAMDLIWSAAEYIRAATAHMESLIVEISGQRQFLRK
ncbi:MAG: hypothetical protein QXR73_02510 [Candidatus Micrarchaeaceae archaeon]